jgi:hypothetical protein
MRAHWSGRLGVVALVALGSVGCVKQPQVRSDQLPVTRVVVYRNGVAYFERSGKVDDEQVEFQLRQENVGDFLATLAILEQGGHSVKAASFPVSMSELEGEGVDPELRAALDSWEGKRPDPRKLRSVTLELDGERHDLTVGYLAETPLWRPSYRLVVDEGGAASLQVWGIVQNQSGEDWQDVELALVAGAPIAFASDLGEPVVPPRPLVTDSGEVITAVPEGSSSYYQAAAPAAAPPAPEASSADEGYAEEQEAYPAMAKRAGASREAASFGPGGAGQSVAAPPPSQLPKDTSRLAAVQVQTGATRYELPYRVSIPDESATMVLLVSSKVKGEAVHLFAPDPGVPDSYRHPLRVVRFENNSPGALEKGPIAVFEKGSFLGQGLMSALPIAGKATVPFALVRDVALESSSRYEERDVRFYAVKSGTLFVEQDRATLTTYEVQSGSNEPIRLLVKHPRAADARLHQPPEGTEDSVADGAAYVPVRVPKFGKASLVVEERMPLRSSVAWESLEGRRAIGQYLDSGSASPEHQKLLREILSQAEALAKLADSERKLRREQRELEELSRETRLSLGAIEKNPKAARLREELTERLARNQSRLDELGKQLVELGLRSSEAEVRLKEARQALEIPPAQ